ncbi:hypothetical protein EW146_g6764 [Bondarzewia mesenterica]|uniref:Xylanolytic transcriptional activator regulatory domain-containing protein n=1 Tax=Bondarzewia mesenterica TaxID=1095465 RepID=A0A4S4LPK8_9AGAM|nr:hypothetical protein EW146_g6764 [Bondarzewia mesenterica]
MPLENTTHRVLAIPELLDIIFSFQDQQSNINAALVCKRWASVALDNVWREVDNLYRLFRILAPLQPTPTYDYSTYAFKTVPSQADWARFAPYARRVRRLEYSTSASSLNVIRLDQSVFNDIARTRTSLVIFPNLRSFTWLVPQHNVLPYRTLFMHDNVQELRTFIITGGDYGPAAQVSDIVGRMPSLTSFVLDQSYPHNAHAIIAPLADLVRGLPRLKQVTVPKSLLTPRIMEELSRLQDLETVQFDLICDHAVEYITESVTSFEAHLLEGAFPALWDLSLGISFADAKRFLTEGTPLPKLTCLLISSLKLDDADVVQDFLSALVVTYPNLLHLYLDIVVPQWEQPSSYLPITFNHIRPILSLKELITFEIRNNLSIIILECDIAEMGAALPNLENLVLNPEPFMLPRPTLTIFSLYTFAEHFPKLKKLGVYIDAGVSGIPEDGVVEFSALELLNIGVSPIDNDYVPIVLFLSRLLAGRDLQFQSGLTWSDDMLGDDDYESVVQDRCNRWEEVAKMLPLLRSLRKEEKSKRMDIEKEVDDLRMRNEVLMESMRTGARHGRSARIGNDCYSNYMFSRLLVVITRDLPPSVYSMIVSTALSHLSSTYTDILYSRWDFQLAPQTTELAIDDPNNSENSESSGSADSRRPPSPPFFLHYAFTTSNSFLFTFVLGYERKTVFVAPKPTNFLLSTYSKLAKVNLLPAPAPLETESLACHAPNAEGRSSSVIGTLAATKGNKVLMAHAQRLTEQVKTMTARIRVLEQALSEAQVDKSSPHPLLRDAGGQDQFREISELESKYEADLENVTIDIGSLSIGLDGRARYYGETAGSEYLQNLISDYDQPTRKTRDPKYLGLPYEILELVRSFPFGLRECPYTKYEFTTFIPPRGRAEQLAELFYAHGAWMYNVVPRTDLKRTILDPIYGGGNGGISLATVHSHRLSLFFMVLAAGAFYDESESLLSEQYNALAFAAYSLDSISQETTTASVQAMFMMCFFTYLTDRSNNEMRWLLSGLAVRVALVIGLQRDSSGWNLDKDEVQRRRVMFWELYAWDAWSSVVSGRPPALNLGYTDCRFPDDVDPYVNTKGEIEMSWHGWKARYSAAVLSASVQRTFTIHGLNYASLLELDKRIRTFPVPPHLRCPSPNVEPGQGWNADPSRAMQQFCIVCEHLLYIHRSYLAQAIRELPTDPLKHKYSSSVLAAYHSACRLISGLRSCYVAYPRMTGNVWFFWSGVFSACIVLGAIVIVSPGSSLAQNSLAELDGGCAFYESGSSGCRPPSTLATLSKLQQRAHRVFGEHHANAGAGNTTLPQRREMDPDEPDELRVLGGRKSVINRSPSTSPNSSSAASPAAQSGHSTASQSANHADIPTLDHIYRPPVPAPVSSQIQPGPEYVPNQFGDTSMSWAGYYDTVGGGQHQHAQSLPFGQAPPQSGYGIRGFTPDSQVQGTSPGVPYMPPPAPVNPISAPMVDHGMLTAMPSAAGYSPFGVPPEPLQQQQQQYAPPVYPYPHEHQRPQTQEVRVHPAVGGPPGSMGVGGGVVGVMQHGNEPSQDQIWYDFVQGLGVSNASNSECCSLASTTHFELSLICSTMRLQEVVLCATTPSSSAGGSGAIILHDIQTGSSLASFKQTSSSSHCTAVVNTADGQGGFMLAAQPDKSILNVYNFQKVLLDDDLQNEVPTPYTHFSDHTLPITDILCGIGDFPLCRLLTASVDHSVKLWDLSSNTLLTTFHFPHAISRIAWDITERLFFAASADGSIHQVNLFRKRMDKGGGIATEAVGGAGVSDIVRIGDEDPREAKKRLISVGEPITTLTISLTSSLLLVGTSTGVINIYDIPSHQLLRTITTHKGFSITHLETMLKPPDLIGHVSLSLSVGGDTSREMPVRPVLPFQRMRDAKAREAHEVTMVLPAQDKPTLESTIVYSSAELLRDYSFFVRPTSASEPAPAASLQSRVTELEDEVGRLREQLGRAKGMNDVMWQTVVQKVVAQGKEKVADSTDEERSRKRGRTSASATD